MKTKILSLSKDKRNFVRAPPSGVTFEFDYASVSAVALAILQEDPQLEKMRYICCLEIFPERSELSGARGAIIKMHFSLHIA